MSRYLKYKEILNYLKELVENGKVMDRLPTEKEISHRFGVSHITDRRAFAELEKSSLVIRLPGRGTFIKEKYTEEKAIKYLVVLPPKRSATGGFFIPPIVSGILSAELDKEFDISTFSYNYNVSEILDLCANSGINGII